MVSKNKEKLKRKKKDNRPAITKKKSTCPEVEKTINSKQQLLY